MGLATRIEKQGDNLKGRRGCTTCNWYAELSKADKQAFDQWVMDGNSVRGLWRMCCEEGLDISCTPFRDHVYNHHPAGAAT